MVCCNDCVMFWVNMTHCLFNAIIMVCIYIGKDLIGLAQTGSGKTGAFAIPILQSLLENPQAFYACVLSPTRFVMLYVN